MSRVRLILLNFLNYLLKEYSHSESRFLRSPLIYLYSHIGSDSFREIREKLHVKNIEQAGDGGDSDGGNEYEIYCDGTVHKENLL